MPSLADTLMKLPTRSKVVLAVAVLGVVFVLLMMLRLASSPSYTMLVSSLDPAETGKVTAALDEKGIAYDLRANGTSVAVEKAAVSEARIALAGAGVAASGSQVGFELFDKQKLGASDFQQKVTYQRALEGEIAKTVESVDGVTGAQVQLVLPEDSLFADEASPATAAVMLTGASDGLEPGAVRGIAQLTASSVKGLKSENVTITDGGGQLLWPQGDDAGAGGGASGSGKQAAQTRYERALQASLDALLMQTLGPGKARVQVKADLNVDQTSREKLTIDGKPVPSKQITETEKLKGGSARAGGAAGTAGNIPSYSAGAAGGGGNSKYDRKSKTVENQVPKTIEKTTVAPGAVNGLQVALVVDKSVPPEDFTAIQSAVKSAAGLDEERGDVFEAAQIAFAKPPAEAKAGPVPVGMLGPLKWVGLGLATLVFMFFMARSLRKREGEALASPSWLTEIAQPVPLAQLEAPTIPKSSHPTLVLPPREQDQAAQAMEQLMDREPERVAAQVRAWMSEE